MTYIEFFDKSPVENITTCLLGDPERVIFIGDNSKMMKRAVANYEKVFAARGKPIPFLWETVSRNDLEAAVEVLTRLVKTYDNCVFDLTGGEEIYALALGIVYAGNPDRNIQLHKYNVRSNTVHDCDKDNTPVFTQIPALTVEENIQIHGGDILYGTVDEDETYEWELDMDFLDDIEAMWNICKNDIRDWNIQISILEAVKAVGEPEDGGRTVVASMSEVERYLSRRGYTYKKNKSVLSALMKAGLVTWFDDESGNSVIVSFKDRQVKRCLTKAGQILEMVIFVMARGIREKDGSFVYDDAKNGVVIDWDGKVLHEEEDYDTENEIDIILMHGLIPVFVSCKNGMVTSDELYKLSSVANRFGGKYAKKVLVATSLSNRGDAAYYLRQRAKDMGIHILEDVQDLTETELEKQIKNFWTI